MQVKLRLSEKEITRMAQKKRKNKILIIEDSPLNQRMLEAILKDYYIIKKVGSAREAFSVLDRFTPDLILLDIILPDANGFDLLKILVKNKSTAAIPVIIISGLTDEENEEKGFLLGAVDYIKKPFKNAIVRARIATQIQIVNNMRDMERMSFIDSLTGVFNRRAFDIKLQYELGRAIRERCCLSLLMIDVDEFKSYNDTYGHLQGDVMLQAVAIKIKSLLNRSTDVLCRYGGEEFAVILPMADSDGAIIVAEKLRRGIAEMQVPALFSDAVTGVTISIGATTQSPTVDTDTQSIIKAADMMLYRAKEAGRNQVRYSN